MSKPELKERIRQVAETPALLLGDAVLDELARQLLESNEDQQETRVPASYQTWGSEIDPAAHQQMLDACHLPDAVAGALMPDAHVGYGLPIGGVLAMENAVVPYAVGVDMPQTFRQTLRILEGSSINSGWLGCPLMCGEKRSPTIAAVHRSASFAGQYSA